MKVKLPGIVSFFSAGGAEMPLKILSVLVIALLMALTVWTGGW